MDQKESFNTHSSEIELYFCSSLCWVLRSSWRGHFNFNATLRFAFHFSFNPIFGIWIMRTLPSQKEIGTKTTVTNFTFFLVLLGVLCWSRPVGPLGPSNFFYPILTGGTTWKLMKSPCNYKVKKKLEGLRGATCLDQQRTPRSTRKRQNWSPTFQCPSLSLRRGM